MAKRVKYDVGFGFSCGLDGLTGKSPVRVMDFECIEFMLAAVDPFNHEKWMADIRSLRRRGDIAQITTTSGSETHGDVFRVIIVKRH